MKKWTNEKYTLMAIYTVLVILAALLFLLAVLNFGQILSFLSFLLFSAKSVIYGILIALVLYPLTRRIEVFSNRHIIKSERMQKKWTVPLSVTLTFLIFLMILAILVISVIPMLHENYKALTDAITGYINSAITSIQQNEFIYNIFLAITGVEGDDASAILQTLVNRYSNLFSNLASSLMNILLAIVYGVSDFLIAAILAFYFLLSRNHILAIFRKLANAFFPRRFLFRSARFFRSFYINVMEFLSARIACSLIIGTLSYFVAWLLGIPFHPLIALTAFVLNMIPVLGPIAAALLCSLIVFILQPRMTLIFFLLLAAANVIEGYFIEHYLLSRRLRPGIAIVLVVELAAYVYTGFVGMIFAVPVFVTLRAQFQVWINRLLCKKGLSLSTADYMSETGAEIYEEQVSGITDAPAQTVQPTSEPPLSPVEETSPTDESAE